MCRAAKVEIQRWKKKRQTTFIVFCLAHFTSGMVHTLFTSTCWVYITGHLKTERPFLIYALMTFFQYLPNLLFGLITANLHDRFRQTKLFMIAINFLCLTGGIMYTIDVSVYYPVAACFLFGIRYFMPPIAVGELARSYPSEELTSKIPVMNFFRFLGSGPASLSNFLSQNINVNIGPVTIDYGNFPGLIITITYITLQILTLLLVHNISWEYDLKAHIEEEKEEKQCESQCLVEANGMESTATHGKNNIDDPPISMKIKRIVNSPDVMLMYFLVFLFNYIAYFSFSYAPLLIQSELHYSAQYVNLYYLVFTVMSVLFLPVIIFMKVSSKFSYNAGIISYILVIIIGVCYKMADPNQQQIYNLALLLVIAVLYAVVYTVEDIFLLCTIAKFVKADIQSFADGIRGIVKMFGGATGCLSVPLFIKNKDVFNISLLLTLLLSIVMMFARRSTLKNPQAIV